jgi:hypothetical protein
MGFPTRNCADCSHCKVKGGVLAYCAKGHWQTQNGQNKSIDSKYVRKSSLAKIAEYCDDYEGEDY